MHILLETAPLHAVLRIDIGLEGDWSNSVVTVWTREAGFTGFETVAAAHARFKPSLELYYDGGWIGLHCYQDDGTNRFDEALAREIIARVEASAA